MTSNLSWTVNLAIVLCLCAMQQKCEFRDRNVTEFSHKRSLNRLRRDPKTVL